MGISLKCFLLMSLEPKLIYFVLGALVSNYLSGLYTGMNEKKVVEGEPASPEEEGGCHDI